MSINKQIVITFIVLLVSIVFFGLNDVDLVIQDKLFNFQTKQFVLLAYDNAYKFIFYDGIKRALILFAVTLFILLLFFRKKQFMQGYKKGIVIVLLSALLVPSIVGQLKDHTNMPCPKDEIRYNGYFPRTAVWECYPENFAFKKIQLKCWPAGHASGGFALMSLFFLFKKRKNRFIALGVAFIIAWSMGIYKMLIGDHFFSHTVITMVLAWFIILLIVKLVNKFSKA